MRLAWKRDSEKRLSKKEKAKGNLAFRPCSEGMIDTAIEIKFIWCPYRKEGRMGTKGEGMTKDL